MFHTGCAGNVKIRSVGWGGSLFQLNYQSSEDRDGVLCHSRDGSSYSYHEDSVKLIRLIASCKQKKCCLQSTHTHTHTMRTFQLCMVDVKNKINKIEIS